MVVDLSSREMKIYLVVGLIVVGVLLYLILSNMYVGEGIVIYSR